MLCGTAAVFSVGGLSPHVSLGRSNCPGPQQWGHHSSDLTGKEKPHPEGTGAAHCPLTSPSLVFRAGEVVVSGDSGKDRDTGGTSICSVSLAWVLGPSFAKVPQVGLLGVAGIWVLWQMVGQSSGTHMSIPISQIPALLSTGGG